MCLQCMTKAVSYGPVFPGFVLMKAIKTDYPGYPDMQTWKEGQYGIVECNDPTIYLTTTPMKDDDSDAFWDAGNQTENDVMSTEMGAKAVHRLIEAAITKGYDLKESGIFGFWLTNYLAEFLETATIIEDDEDNE